MYIYPAVNWRVFDYTSCCVYVLKGFEHPAVHVQAEGFFVFFEYILQYAERFWVPCWVLKGFWLPAIDADWVFWVPCFVCADGFFLSTLLCAEGFLSTLLCAEGFMSTMQLFAEGFWVPCFVCADRSSVPCSWVLKGFYFVWAPCCTCWRVFSIPCCVHAERFLEPCRVFEYTLLWVEVFWVPCCALKGFWVYPALCWRDFWTPCCVHTEEFSSTLPCTCAEGFSSTLLCTRTKFFFWVYTAVYTLKGFEYPEGFWVPCSELKVFEHPAVSWRVFEYPAVCWRVFRVPCCVLKGFWVPCCVLKDF